MQEFIWISPDLFWCQGHAEVSSILTPSYHFSANLKGNWNDYLNPRCLYHTYVKSLSTGVYKSDLSLFRSLKQFQKLPNTKKPKSPWSDLLDSSFEVNFWKGSPLLKKVFAFSLGGFSIALSLHRVYCSSVWWIASFIKQKYVQDVIVYSWV